MDGFQCYLNAKCIHKHLVAFSILNSLLKFSLLQFVKHKRVNKQTKCTIIELSKYPNTPLNMNILECYRMTFLQYFTW